ncbi:MAG: SAM-dependent methyltransferase [Cytophagaceae bacterium]|nr:SAM-dependent methyltransferase [Cytophagaceae bacterium]
MTPSSDIFGLALNDIDKGQTTQDIIVSSSIADDDYLPLAYLCRSYDEMPQIEQQALKLCKGKTLDIGSGAGSHSLWLHEQGIEVMGLDLSRGAIDFSRKRLEKSSATAPYRLLNQNVFEHKGQYDTLLLLMNGTGIFGTIANVDDALQHLKALLSAEGQILIDSSDIKYMYEDEDGGFWVDTHKEYYGEVTYQMHYKGEKGPLFEWLYLDFETLASFATQNGLQCRLIMEGPHYDYLARLTLA